MTIILKKGQKLEELMNKTARPEGVKKLNARKYVGVLKLNEDPLEIQRKMRDEWG